MDVLLKGDSSSKQSKLIADQNKQQQLEPALSSSSFSELINRLVNNTAPSQKPATLSSDGGTVTIELQQPEKTIPIATQVEVQTEQTPTPQPHQAWPKRACRAPLLRKFAQPCNCGSSNHNKYFYSGNTSNNISLIQGALPPVAYTSPLHLYDPATRKCLPTSRNRDMLLKECHPHFSTKPHHHVTNPCVYDDLVCDANRKRCVCKPSLHLYYEPNLSTFGCVPLGNMGSPDGRVTCGSGLIYNVISKDCQKIFDVNDLPPNYSTGVSATQFSFVTIVLIWILLLILIVTAKLRKLRTSNVYRNSPTSERRSHGNAYRAHHGPNRSTWLHPFIAAVNGHHHLNHHRTTVDRFSLPTTVDEAGNFNDTDFFLANGNRRVSDNNFAGSQLSLNNPPPKFEEIYPSCPIVATDTTDNNRSACNEDLPTYDEAMKLQNTVPPDPKE